MAQGRPVFGHNDHQSTLAPDPGPASAAESSAVSFEDSDVVRSAIRVEGFRDDEFNYQLIRAIGRGRLRRFDGGRVPGRGGRDHRREPAELGRRLRAPGPAGGGPGSGLPGGRAPGQRPRTTCCGRPPTTAPPSTTPTGSAGGRTGWASAARPASPTAPALVDPPVELDRGALRGRDTARLPGPPGRCRRGDGPSPPHPGRGGRVRLECRGALLPPGGARGRAGVERVRLRRPRPARVHAGQPGDDLPTRLRGADRRGDRPPRPTSPDVDSDRLALAGQSFGSYFAARSAATDARVRRPGGRSADRRHEPVHGGMGGDRRLPDDPGHPARGRHRRARGPDAPPDAVGDRRHLLSVRRAVVPRLAGGHGRLPARRLGVVGPLPGAGPDRRPRGGRAAGPVRCLRRPRPGAR